MRELKSTAASLIVRARLRHTHPAATMPINQITLNDTATIVTLSSPVPSLVRVGTGNRLDIGVSVFGMLVGVAVDSSASEAWSTIPVGDDVGALDSRSAFGVWVGIAADCCNGCRVGLNNSVGARDGEIVGSGVWVRTGKGVALAAAVVSNIMATKSDPPTAVSAAHAPVVAPSKSICASVEFEEILLAISAPVDPFWWNRADNHQQTHVMRITF